MATRVSQFRTVSPALVEHRSAHRHRILLTQARMAAREASPVEAMLDDLSVYGCRIACRVEHGEGDSIWLRLRGDQPVAAKVVWNDGEHIGCRFDAPIERSLVRQLTLVIR